MIHVRGPATAALFLDFVTVLCVAFATPRLLIPYAVFAIFIVAFFAVPAMWARMKPERRITPLAWDEFREKGIDTMTDRTPAGEATTLVLILPTPGLTVVPALPGLLCRSGVMCASRLAFS